MPQPKPVRVSVESIDALLAEIDEILAAEEAFTINYLQKTESKR